MQPPDANQDRSPLAAPFADWDDARLQQHLKRQLPSRILVQPDPIEGSRQQADSILADRYHFIGETHHWHGTPDWLANPSRDIEWHILLHKFYFAVGLAQAWQATADPRYREKWIALTHSWIEQTPPGFIAADVTGRRIQNWVQAYSLFVDDLPTLFHVRFLQSLHAQVEWLCANLHAARNHRTLELSAIFLAGVAFPEYTRAPAWTRFALDAIVENMQRDLRPDGVHCEQSTDYHHLVLRNYLNVRRIASMNDIEVPSVMDELLERALEFSMFVHRPDGRVPALSDGDVNDYRELLEQGHTLFGRRDMRYVATGGKYGSAPLERSRLFSHSGYAILRSGWGDSTDSFADQRYLVFDCGPLGEGNHGHLDLLSFEAYGYGHALVVDPGRYTYHEDEQDNWRVRFRGTGYHNTVQIDGRNQTRYVQGPKKFKIAGLAPEFDLSCFQTGPNLDYVCGIARSHEYDVVHERRIAFVRGQYWVVVDTLEAPLEHQYAQLFHLSPLAWRRTAVVAREGLIRALSPHLLIAHLPGGDVEFGTDDGFVSERYGSRQPAPILRFTRHAACARFITVMLPFRLEVPAVRIVAEDTLTITIGANGVSTTDCLSLTREDATLGSSSEERHHA